VAPGPLLLASLLVEGPSRISTAFSAFHPDSLAAFAYVVVISTFGGFGAWTSLLRRYPASSVAPFTLLVPVVGMATAAVFTGEHPTSGELAGAAIVVAGLITLSMAVSGQRPILGRKWPMGPDSLPGHLEQTSPQGDT
jgi:O-acetylserine/cysteine efflux transporter